MAISRKQKAICSFVWHIVAPKCAMESNIFRHASNTIGACGIDRTASFYKRHSGSLSQKPRALYPTAGPISHMASDSCLTQRLYNLAKSNFISTAVYCCSGASK